MIRELILQAQENDTSALDELIKLFNPLLQKYSRLMNEEDAYSNLAADFIGVIKSRAIAGITNGEDSVFIAYIKKAAYHSYIYHQKKKRKMSSTFPMSSLSEADLHKIEYSLSIEDDYSSVEIRGFKGVLTKKEYNILAMVYLDGEMIADIAHNYGVSRQAVNQVKLAAVKKIRMSL